MHKRIGFGLAVAALWFSFAAIAATTVTPLPIEAHFTGTKAMWLDFAEPMQTWANEARSDVVRTMPALATTCSWDSDTRLACRLEQDVAQATRYRVDITGGLKTQRGTVLPPAILHVESLRPALTASVTQWRNGVPEIQLAANQPVSAESLRSKLRLSMGDVEIPVPPLRPVPSQWSGDTKTRFALALPAVGGFDRLLTLQIVPGLIAQSGPLPGTQDETLLYMRVNERFSLRGVECAGREKPQRMRTQNTDVAADCMPGELIELVFPRPFDAASRNRIAGMLPAGVRMIDWKPRQYDGSGYHHRGGIAVTPSSRLQLEMAAANAEATLTLDGSLKADDGMSLTPVQIHLRTSAARPRLRARHARVLIVDGRKLPVLIEAVNAGRTAVDVQSLGTRPRSEVLTTPEHRDSNPLALASPVTTEALGEGGWVRWTPTGLAPVIAGHQPTLASIDFAAPAFDLHAIVGRREVLAWVNEWDRDAAVAGADVELLWRNSVEDAPRVVARARTEDDGVALLQLPDDVVVPEEGEDGSTQPLWLLRAAKGTRGDAARAVLPLGGSRSWGIELGKRLPRKTWGVSDRPMYRAGDVVNYRLWQRDLDGGHLVPLLSRSPARMQLHDENHEKVILEWQATPTPDGGIAGTLTLPIHLSDATYCIGVNNEFDNTDGACFFVGTYRAQDLWAEMKSPARVLRDGQRFVADLRAGYFSGGPAAGVGVDQLNVELDPLPLEEAYPQYATFHFIDVTGDDVEVLGLKGLDDDYVLGPQGDLRIDVPLALDATPEEFAHRPAFGELFVDAEVSPEGREGTTAGDGTTRYARFERYVGLKTNPSWLDATGPIHVEAVVINAEGLTIAGAEVEVEIDYLPGFGDGGAPQRLAHCVVHAQSPAPCDFPRARSGRFRLTARSADAAPTELIRYVWIGDDALSGEVDDSELTLLDGSPQRDVPLRVLMKQPNPHGRVLFVFGSGEKILGHRVEAVTGNVQGYALPLAPQWRGAMELRAYVRDVAVPPQKDGYRVPANVNSLQVSIPSASTRPVVEPVTVHFEPSAATPGATAHVIVRNNSAQPRDVVLSVMDDALRSLAQRWLDYADPLGPLWLGALQRPNRGLIDRNFETWNDAPWSLLLPWPQPELATAKPRTSEPLDQPSILVEDASPVDIYPVPSAVAPAGEMFDGDDSPTSLDRVEVTGSRIKRVELEPTAQKAPDPGLHARRDDASRGSSPAVRQLARVRTQFADTALWVPDIRLLPGESRTIELKLPDNLTRWRAVVWSGDSGDDFAMAEATLETGLPLEVRLQAPVRIYPGDRARIGSNVRQTGETAVVATTGLHVEGAGVPFDDAGRLPLGPQGQASVATTITPAAVGMLQITASAEIPAGRDAVAMPLEVASPFVVARKLQAGWLGDTPLTLDLPTLPASARDLQLHVALLRGSAGLVDGWTRDLRDYPHRCWEQILSRAVAAALVLERNDASWPGAKDVVREALDNAAVFQGNNGAFRYFVDSDSGYGAMTTPDSSVSLTAYTLRAFELLRALGHPVSERIETQARDYLAKIVPTAADGRAQDRAYSAAVASEEKGALARFAFAAAERDGVERTHLETLWSNWQALPLPAQIAVTRALAAGHHAGAAEAMTRLLANAPARGPARVLRLPHRYDQWMSSDLGAQCSLVELLRDFPNLSEPATRQALIAGMTDLYEGGVASVDTQTGATCLMALRDRSGPDDNAVAAARIDVGASSTELRLAPGERRVDWNAGAPSATQLRIRSEAQGDSPVSFVAETRYMEDAREARASAVGFSIERNYAVLRDAAWTAVAGQTLRVGDWIRISLTIDTSAPRQFVAVTDAIPGGLRPTDLALSGVAGRDLERVSYEGSGVFTTRKLDPRSPRFYAEVLPAGRHELHYFALVGNGGDYLAAPATAELMYGNASSARTAATRVRIEPTTE